MINGHRKLHHMWHHGSKKNWAVDSIKLFKKNWNIPLMKANEFVIENGTQFRIFFQKRNNTNFTSHMH